MTPLTRQILDGLAADDADAFLAASETIRAFTWGTASNSGIVPPYAQALAASPPAIDDIAAIKAVLIEYIQAGRGSNLACAVHAVGTLEGDDVIALLREALAQHLRAFLGQNQIVGNLICALSNHGERVMSGQSFSLFEIDKNVADARRYLARFGEVMPW